MNGFQGGDGAASPARAPRVITSLPPVDQVDWDTLPSARDALMLASMYLLGTPVTSDQCVAALNNPEFRGQAGVWLAHRLRTDGETT